MKSHLKWNYLLGLMIFLFFAPVFEMTARADESWNTRMQAMAGSITCLAPFVVSDAKFNDPKNRLRIHACVDDLALQTKSLNDALTAQKDTKDTAALHQLDPLFALMAKSFSDDVETARTLLDSSGRTYAQHLLRGSLSYCVSCHTRTEEHASIKFPVFKDLGADVKLSEQMQLLTATRNFNEALELFHTRIRSPEIEKLGPFELERSARLALAIAVRVQDNGDKALALVDQILKIKNLAPSFKNDLANWRTSLARLKTAGASTGPSPADPMEKFKLAQRLIKQASGDQNGVPEIEYLRASALIHQFLESRPSNQLTAEALFALGTCYEHLESLGIWSTNETYYETCILKMPHSEIARRCLQPLKDSLTFGYSGSSGTHIPANVQAHLRELEAMASPK